MEIKENKDYYDAAMRQINGGSQFLAFRKYRYSDIKEGRTDITDYDYDSSQYNDELVSEEMKRDRLKFLSLFVAETQQEIDRLVEIFPDLGSVRRDINEYLERSGRCSVCFQKH